LTIGQHITSLSAGSLDLSNPSDVLLVGTHTHVLAYDVERNIELFHNEVPDGANSIIIGSHLSSGQQLAYVGGNCSIVGFDKDGQDAFWTVTGDNVHSLALVDYDLDGSRELLVGSEDYDIRVFREDELMHEVSEVDTVISMCSLGHNRFGYALTNGIVGVYTGSQKTWSAKSKHFPLMLLSQDINDDGVNELITAWSNGRVDVRHPTTGQVLYKDVFPSAVAGIVKADYRMTGKEELICCSIDGEVRGYSPSSAPPAHSHQLHGNSLLQELHQKKSRLLTELKNYEMTKHISESRDPHTELSRMGSSSSFVGLIPANTQIQTQFTTRTGTDKIQPHIALVVKTTNNTPIRAVVVFSDGLFDGESFIVHPPVDTVTDQVEVPLFPDKDVSYELDIRIFVGQPNSTQYHVFKISRTLVKFALYVPCALDNEPRPTSSVVFQINERIDRVKSFLQSNFLYGLSSDLTVTQSTYLEVAYISLRTNSPIFIKMELDKDNQVSINTDDMDLAGDIIQSMAEAFNIEVNQSITH
jgi:Bardet-Biedl syndrome 2 protein